MVMLGGGSVEMLETLFMHAVVQAAVGRGEHQAHALVGLVFGARADRVQEGKCPFDLLEDGDRVRWR